MATDVKYLISLQDKFSGKMNTINKSTQNLDKSLGRAVGRFASFAAVGAVLTSSVKKIADFEEQVSNLSAITGATGDDLDFLANKAIELGGATTKSSIDTVKAFKLIASAKPELLDNAQALAKVTEEAITLSEASGLELPQAATALTDSLNQFGLAADQSSRVINILAAGSKFASAEIPDLTTSLKEFGGVADSLNISIEESAAAVETLSSKGLKGARAGINLRNVFLKLGAATDKRLNPKVVGLSKALENLAEIEDDTTKLTKMFGRQNVLAAQTLIKERKRVDELTGALTGTNIAYEQASVNTDNLNSDFKRLGSSWERLVLNLNQGSGSISTSLRSATQFATEFLDKLDRINKTSGDIALGQASKEMDEFKASLEGITDIGVLEEKIQAEKKKVETLFDFYEKEQQRLGGREAVEKGFKGVGGFLRSQFNREKELDKQITRERLNSLSVYRKELNKLFRGEGLNKLLTVEPPEVVDPKVEGLDKVEDQVTRITSAAPKTFNINIQKFVENFTVQSETIKESATDVREFFVEQLSLVLADVQAVSG
jgi:TP901 family phage tail tape measure protein